MIIILVVGAILRITKIKAKGWLEFLGLITLILILVLILSDILKTIYTRLIKCYMKLDMINEAKGCFEESLDWIKIEKQEQYKKEILKKYGIT